MSNTMKFVESFNIVLLFFDMQCCKKKERPKNRTVHVGHKHTPEHEVVIEEKFCSNRIVSSKVDGYIEFYIEYQHKIKCCFFTPSTLAH